MIKPFAAIVVVAAIIAPSAASAQNAMTPASPASNAQTFLEFQVESPARVKSHAAPEYPDRLHKAGVEGEVVVQYIVDESGNARMDSFKVLRSSEDAFSESVRKAVSQASFYPAELQGKKVRQLVQQSFRFKK